MQVISVLPAVTLPAIFTITLTMPELERIRICLGQGSSPDGKSYKLFENILYLYESNGGDTEIMFSDKYK